MYKNRIRSPFLLVAHRISPRTTIPLILAIKNGHNRYSELALIFPMSSRTLAKSINLMLSEKLIEKSGDGAYQLTQKGIEFSIHASHMLQWFKKYYAEELEHCSFL